ncbi:cupin domain-containing protein [Maridesulfovibrio sp. FT414]|uniref:cupin domain-containing protein n=1 Tax=Maridesulfovibrio sp. FT414 TaxID=2979469 RepID=UPI003D80025E
METNSHPVPDISRLFIGAKNEFEVETVFAQKGAVSPDESHSFDEILVLLEGEIELETDSGVETLSGLTMRTIPAGTRHVSRIQTTPTRIVIIHPDRL